MFTIKNLKDLKKPELLVSILEAVYLIYMFLFFKTSVDFNIRPSAKGWLFEHLIGDEYGLRICPFGRVTIFVLIFVLVARHFINIHQAIINIILGLSFLIALMNLNAVVYMSPIWLIEIVNIIRHGLPYYMTL